MILAADMMEKSAFVKFTPPAPQAEAAALAAALAAMPAAGGV